MKLVVPPVKIEGDASFGEHDVLGRKSYGEALANLVQKASGELVIALNGNWGEGKTTFVQLWQNLLREREVPSIYIDAFANDYLDDAFITLASAINQFIKSESGEDDQVFKEKAKKVGGRLLSWSAKLAIKAATIGAINGSDIEELQDLKKELSGDAGKWVEGAIAERLDAHTQDLEEIEQFKEALSELPSKLSNGKSNPLVLIIDELDRCKPTYAVELIERVKHLFSVPNVVFVLVMNREQLEESIKWVYGQNIDAHTYLQKFIHLETRLPLHISHHPFDSDDYTKYSERLLELHELETWGDNRQIVKTLALFARHLNFSLRDLERVFTNLALFYASAQKTLTRRVEVIVLLAILKAKKPLLYQLIVEQKQSFERISKDLRLEDIKQTKLNLSEIKHTLNLLQYFLGAESERESVAEAVKDSLEFGFRGPEDIPKYVGRCIEMFNYFTP